MLLVFPVLAGQWNFTLLKCEVHTSYPFVITKTTGDLAANPGSTDATYNGKNQEPDHEQGSHEGPRTSTTNQGQH